MFLRESSVEIFRRWECADCKARATTLDYLRRKKEAVLSGGSRSEPVGGARGSPLHFLRAFIEVLKSRA